MCHSYALNIAPETGKCDVCYYKDHLFNLLAVIHRDGGSYTIMKGLDKSVKDAMKIAEDKIVKQKLKVKK